MSLAMSAARLSAQVHRSLPQQRRSVCPNALPPIPAGRNLARRCPPKERRGVSVVAQAGVMNWLQNLKKLVGTNEPSSSSSPSASSSAPVYSETTENAVLVFGASGKTGREVVAQLLQSGRNVVAAVRERGRDLDDETQFYYRY